MTRGSGDGCMDYGFVILMLVLKLFNIGVESDGNLDYGVVFMSIMEQHYPR